ncbi:DUF2381 family protein [Hyalangium rubrum]|uniref:DUF2381 family protein n=1 Tax=Hyalangium rubrum TaxID=3103134 RepID=A0ABU5HGR3_9BACT|nr:DUF2381 family protein [Hyalangium sp. s54d21]MDY7231280.1 DUF2381 family protein [Hyalangium sp. s54d21]
MRSSCLVRLLVLLPLAGAPLARAQPAPCQPEGRRLELADGTASPPEVCIAPGLSTTLLFDAPLLEGEVVLEGREHFERVEAAGRTLVLVPTEKLPATARLRLEVRFAPGTAPTRAAFSLVARSAQAERLVEVSRPPSPTDSCPARAEQLEAALQQCQAERARTSEPFGDPPSLAAMLIGGMFDERDIRALRLDKSELTAAPGEVVQVERLSLHGTRSRLAVKVLLRNRDARPWVLAGASLTDASGQVKQALWIQRREPLAPGASDFVWLELEMPGPGISPRTFTLQLWDEGRQRTATVRGARLP